MRKITNDIIAHFQSFLLSEEKAEATVEKYLHDVRHFRVWLNGKETDKAAVLAYKQDLIETYAPRSANSMLSSVNRFFDFAGWQDCKVKTLKLQRQTFAEEEKELSKGEYERLLCAAKKRENLRLYYLMQTICSTGIRVSELKFITVQAVKSGQAKINCKGKMRKILLPEALCRVLKRYADKEGIASGAVFCTKSGKPLNRSNIWADMKRLCNAAGVLAKKVFPHNLRHLFARTFYSLQKDIVRLADVLGHSNINTTRIYTMESGRTHLKQIQKIGRIFVEI